jgi:hypothetical protein
VGLIENKGQMLVFSFAVLCLLVVFIDHGAIAQIPGMKQQVIYFET